MAVLQTEDYLGPGTIKIMLELATDKFTENRSQRNRNLAREDRLIEREIEKAKKQGESITIFEAMNRAGIEMDDDLKQIWEESKQDD